MADHTAAQFNALRDIIADTAADLSTSNPVWTAGCLAAALIAALDAAGWQIVHKPEAWPDSPLPDNQLANGGACT